MEELASEYPDVVFEHASGYKMNDTNFGNYFGRIYQPCYLSGIAAGAITEANRIGYVAAFPIPEVIRGINAFTLGAQRVNPDVEVHVAWTLTWFDPAIEGDTASALLEAGADVIAMHQDSTAAGIAAQEAGARWVAYNSDMSAFAPDAYITAPVWTWGPYYASIIEVLRLDHRTGESGHLPAGCLLGRHGRRDCRPGSAGWRPSQLSGSRDQRCPSPDNRRIVGRVHR